ncbi:MAG: hypothetical protein LBQ40_03595 [Clostridiales bacterium]|jgi:RNA polymerase subunit RPABC4/transcription elongation factor Spt4|nr:hypothetical protein [Clostridiales bacterium]
MGYKKCQRCDLNYIPEEEDLCLVCKAQLHIGDVRLLEDEDDEFLELCPVCRVNFISEDEEMCAVCKSNKLKSVFVKEEEIDDNWRSFLDEDVPEEEDILIPLSEIAEEEEEWEDEQEFEDEENKPIEDDFDDFVDLGELGDDDGEDDEDEEDDDDEK